MHKSTKHTRSLGFTIVELLVIIVIIAILVAITIVSYSAVTRNSREQALTADLQTTSSELQKYKSQKGSYPTASEFNASIKKATTAGSTTYTYTVDPISGSFCLVATARGASFNIASNNATVRDGNACLPVSALTITSPSDINGIPNDAGGDSWVVNGKATPGNRLAVGVCARSTGSIPAGSRCGQPYNQMITVDSSGNWSVVVDLTQYPGTLVSIIGNSPVSGSLNCNAAECALQVLDFGKTTSPTNISQAIGQKAIPYVAEVQ